MSEQPVTIEKRGAIEVVSLNRPDRLNAQTASLFEEALGHLDRAATDPAVRVVIDCGTKRAPRFDPGRGMTQLVSIRVSRAAAEQRRGRAGRLGPGVCYRLWTEPEDRGLKPYDEPEMLQADLAVESKNQQDVVAAIKHVEAIGDFQTRTILAEILADTEEHIDWLETQRELISRVGLENFQQSQMATE
jgi:hypothetical protein